ncbi:hypothetical protein COO60DRAFT_394722 [Scenedesmus sp. NREL 46B-D3]|nr:hypothetical protein COO60DRAFT_394722 [Scenedesmus sp. NREL 46B-D3]
MPAGRAWCFCLWGSSSTIAPLSAQRCKSEQSFTPDVHILHCIRFICCTAADLPHLLTFIADPSRCAQPVAADLESVVMPVTDNISMVDAGTCTVKAIDMFLFSINTTNTAWTLTLSWPRQQHLLLACSVLVPAVLGGQVAPAVFAKRFKHSRAGLWCLLICAVSDRSKAVLQGSSKIGPTALLA